VADPSLGAVPAEGGVGFRVWAPAASRVELILEQGALGLGRGAGGYHSAFVGGAAAGDRYSFRLDGGSPMPDPASRFQPDGVHGPSQVVDPGSYRWQNDNPEGPGEEPGAIYELHVGTFSPEGTFAGVGEKLEYLAGLGVGAIELMPLADFPGRWNWGYDPAALFAPSRAYGTPNDLRRLVDRAHGLGLRMMPDVVYNHFGPDGAYLPAFSPFVLTSRHATPWGQAVDVDGPESEGVRRYILENALMWLDEYRFDGLRLDATFAIVDDGPQHILAQLSAAVAGLPGRKRLLIAEDPRNLRNVVLPTESGGLGLGAVWADDFHHQVRVRLAGDRNGYYRDFSGGSRDITETILANWFYRGHHSVSHGAPRGTPAADLPPARFVYCIQNHDQVGNRPRGNRLSDDVSPPAYRAASTLLLFLPQRPMLFMGQEWAAGTPFLYFTDHAGELAAQVREGRRREFADFDMSGEVPDPQDPLTFERSRLDWPELDREPHAGVLRLYRDLLELRRSLRGPVTLEETRAGGVSLRRETRVLLVAFEGPTELALPEGAEPIWCSEDSRYAGDSQRPALARGIASFRRPGALIVEVAP
jgi:maltooligosyltrehalose trehalohydrolase